MAKQWINGKEIDSTPEQDAAIAAIRADANPRVEAAARQKTRSQAAVDALVTKGTLTEAEITAASLKAGATRS